MSAAGPMTLVCVPGTMCAPLIFAPLRDTGLRVEVIAWNESTPPHSIASIAQVVADAVAAHSPAVLIGHSTGGVIALSAVLGGARPEGMILFDTGADMHDHPDVDSIVRRVRDDWGPELWQAHIARSVTLEVPTAVREELEAYPSVIDPVLVQEILRDQQATDLNPRLAEIDVPCLVVHGLRDPARLLAHSERLAAGLPHAALVTVDCGHTPPIELPGPSTRLVEDFVASLR